MKPTTATDRNQRCGASDGAAALGLSPRRTAWETWAEKSGRLEPFAGNEATRMGQALEATILDVAETELGPLSRGDLVFADGTDFPLAATLDARVKSSGVPVEAKTSGIVGPIYGEWGDPDSDVVPQYYLVQVMLQMICTGAEFAHIYALLGGRGVVRYRAVYDAELARELTERLARWWQRHIVEGIEPARTEPVPLEVVKRLRRQPSKTIALAPEDLVTVAEYEDAKAIKSCAAKSCDAAQAKLLMLLGDAEAAELPDGRTLYYQLQKRKGFTVAESEFRAMRIKKA